MITHKNLLIITLVIIGFVLTGCFDDESNPSGPDKDQLIGTWVLTDYTIDGEPEETQGITVTFNEDGSGTVLIFGHNAPLTWSTDGDQLTITFDGEVTTGTYTVNSTTFTYTFDDDDGINAQIYERRTADNSNSVIEGKVTDSQTGEGIEGATISSDDDNSVITNSSGSYSLDVTAGTREITVSKSGYFSINRSVQVDEDSTVTQNFILVPILGNGEGLLRLVLSWNENPSDLDSHMETPMIEGQAYHISYSEEGSKDSAPFVTLDNDETDGYGPETITIHQLFTGTYKYYVHKFSEEIDLAGCGAQVRIYNTEGLQNTVTIPENGEGLYWQVCTIDGDGNVVIVNEINQGNQGHGNGLIEGRVTHSQTGDPIQDATVTIDATNSTTTDSNGEYSLEVDAGSHTISVSKDGFYENSEDVYVNADETVQQNFALTPTLVTGEGVLRLVLTWQDEPKDLDSHLLTPVIDGSTYHIYHGDEGNKDTAPYATLDIDDQDGYGPETITIHRLFTGTYNYYIYNYTLTSSMANCGAKVQIYNTDGLLNTIYTPTTGNGEFWHICYINGNGEVTVVNEIKEENPGFTVGSGLKPSH
ncbi:MAG: carboxypeptidase regulatory-like domain-containing protein [Calditrichaeota bacterium]|nr:carboxypeptidase regulatory-like domain-containing protein [Calditrichota bacterium]